MRWTQVQLMARTANVSTQPAQLWRKTGAALLPTVVVRAVGTPRHRIVVGAPVLWHETGNRQRDVQVNMQAAVDRFVPWIRSHPDHYLQFMLMRRRVRTTDVRPFFTDYPDAEDGLSSEQAAKRLREAGERT